MWYNLVEILKAQVTIINKEVKTSYNKVLVKADANTKIMYLTEDNRIGRITGKIPVVGFIDIQNISEDNMIDKLYDDNTSDTNGDGFTQHTYCNYGLFRSYMKEKFNNAKTVCRITLEDDKYIRWGIQGNIWRGNIF